MRWPVAHLKSGHFQSEIIPNIFLTFFFLSNLLTVEKIRGKETFYRIKIKGIENREKFIVVVKISTECLENIQ